MTLSGAQRGRSSRGGRASRPPRSDSWIRSRRSLVYSRERLGVAGALPGRPAPAASGRGHSPVLVYPPKLAQSPPACCPLLGSRFRPSFLGGLQYLFPFPPVLGRPHESCVLKPKYRYVTCWGAFPTQFQHADPLPRPGSQRPHTPDRCTGPRLEPPRLPGVCPGFRGAAGQSFREPPRLPPDLLHGRCCVWWILRVVPYSLRTEKYLTGFNAPCGLARNGVFFGRSRKE